MKKFVNKYCVKWIVISELVGVVSGVLSIKGMGVFNATQLNATLTPPGWVFPVVWTILYALMGIGACLVDNGSDTKNESWCLNLFVAQLIVNFFWSLIFFNALAFGVALLWLIFLWILVLMMTFCFLRISKFAAWLQVPYIVWLTFAIYLNASVWLLNS